MSTETALDNADRRADWAEVTKRPDGHLKPFLEVN